MAPGHRGRSAYKHRHVENVWKYLPPNGRSNHNVKKGQVFSYPGNLITKNDFLRATGSKVLTKAYWSSHPATYKELPNY